MVKNAITLFLALVVSFQALGQQLDTKNLDTFRREVKVTAELLRLPGLSVAIIQDGKIIYRQHEGYADLEAKKPVNDDSIFWLSSVTKALSAVMMLQYEKEGRLSLEDPLIKFPFASVGFAPQHKLEHSAEACAEPYL